MDSTIGAWWRTNRGRNFHTFEKKQGLLGLRIASACVVFCFRRRPCYSSSVMSRNA
jgi:hypothetical protein